MASSSREDLLKNAVYLAIREILNTSDQQCIHASQARLKTLEVVQEYGIYLLQIALNGGVSLDVRQLSAIILKQYVTKHWSRKYQEFVEPECSTNTKNIIRSAAIGGLGDSNPMIRKSIALIVSSIVYMDYPEYWPEFLDGAHTCISEGNQYQRNGAVLVFYELSIGMTAQDILRVGSKLMWHSYSIFHREGVDVQTFSKIIKMFRTIIEKISYMKSCSSTTFDYMLTKIFPLYVMKLIDLVQQSDGPQMDCDLRSNILRTFSTLISRMPEDMESFMQQILPIMWQILISTSNDYSNFQVMTPVGQEKLYETDGYRTIDSQIISLFNCILEVVENESLATKVDTILPELLYHAIIFTQITEKGKDLWMNDLTKFIEDENEESLDFDVKAAANNLLKGIFHELDSRLTIPALCKAINKHLVEAEAMKSANNPHWWKRLEAVMVVLCLGKKLMIEGHNNNLLIDFSLVHHVDTVGQYVQADGIPLLQCRSMWLSGNYCSVMSPNTLNVVVRCIINHLETKWTSYIRIAATRSLRKFCEYFAEIKDYTVIHPLLENAVNGLFSIMHDYGDPSLDLTLETLILFIKVDPKFTLSIESKIIPLTNDILIKYWNDPTTSILVLELINVLSRLPGLIVHLEQRTVPILVSALNSEKKNTGLQSMALDALALIVRHPKEPYNNIILMEAFPATINCILNSDDSEVLQNGGECIRNFLAGYGDHLLSYRDADGKLGLDYILRVIYRLLDPTSSEYNASYVGRLIITLIMKAGDRLGDQVEALLRSILSKMHLTEAPLNMHSLILTFTYLFYTDFQATLTFLTVVPGPSGQSALQFVMTEWMNCYYNFIDPFSMKICTIAITKLLQYALTNDNSNISNITLTSEKVDDKESVPSLSADNSAKWINIPLIPKLFKLIFCIVIKQLEINELNNGNAVKELCSISLCPYLNGQCDDNHHALDYFEVYGDSRFDEIINMNLLEHIKVFLSSCDWDRILPCIKPYATSEELSVLSRIDIDFS